MKICIICIWSTWPNPIADKETKKTEKPKTKNQKGLQIKLRLERQRLEIQHNWAKLLVRDILPGDIIPYSEESEP